MKRARPLLCLDVDGVLCPMDDPGGYRRVATGDGDWVWVSDENCAHLRRLARSFKLVWATSWEHNANRIIAPLHGIGRLPVIEWDVDALGLDPRPDSQPEDWTGYHDWKLPWIQRYAEARPFAWIDDEISDRGLAWARTQEVPTLLIRPNSAVGLLAQHVETLIEFAEGA